MKYGIDSTWHQLQEDEDALKLVKEYLPEITSIIEVAPGAERISFRSLWSYTSDKIPEGKLQKLDEVLKHYGERRGLTEKEKQKISRYQSMKENRTSRRGTPVSYREFTPGKIWLDTNGNPIQAHGGALFFENGTYYWYGENKEYTDGINGIWTWGIRMYRSTDLYNWEDLGLIAEPDVDDPDSPLFPEKYVDRPHILHCRATGKYVMWIKLSGPESCFAIFQADALTGPYHLQKGEYHPEGSSVGDFDIVVDADTEKAYLFMDSSPKSIAGYELTGDYLAVSHQVSRQYENLTPPFCREGVAVFEHSGRKYMITSGMSGYTPNQSEVAAADQWTDHFVPLGDPHVGDTTMASFNSQISQVFRLPGTDRYIALADRWMPDHMLTGSEADSVRRVIASRYQPDVYQASQEERECFQARPDLERCNTSISTYVWLPVQIVDGMPRIFWKDHWKKEDML